LGALGCTPENKVPHGAPEVVEVLYFDPTTESGMGSITGDTPIFPATPFLSVVFDRLLDPAAIVDIDPDGGTFITKNGVGSIDSSTVGPVELTTLAADMLNGLEYTHNGHYRFAVAFSKGPTLTFNLKRGSLPAASRVTLFLDKDRVRSHDKTVSFTLGQGDAAVPPYGGGATGPDGSTMGVGTPSITFDTQPATAEIQLPDPPDGGSAQPAGAVPLLVFNIVAAAADVAAGVHVTANGAPIAIEIVPVEGQGGPIPYLWSIIPLFPGWPAGATIAITVDATITDAYGIALASAASVSFMVAQ
jgi:hypothetical protein